MKSNSPVRGNNHKAEETCSTMTQIKLDRIIVLKKKNRNAKGKKSWSEGGINRTQKKKNNKMLRVKW